MANLLLLTGAPGSSAEVLPSLALLGHVVRVLPMEAVPLLDAPPSDIILLDARRELAAARQTCRLLRTTGTSSPLVAVMSEGGLAAVAADWGLDDIRSGDLSIDEATYQASLGNRVLDLTFKEFELLKYLAQHPGRVFTRAQLLQEVWGYDYFGGTRTVDVHVRRLRAKLGPDREALIGTVRNVGYKFVAQPIAALPEDALPEAALPEAALPDREASRDPSYR
jgi:DNA-binding response OmpR family regulator